MKFGDLVRDEGVRVRLDESPYGVARKSWKVVNGLGPLVEVKSWGGRRLRYRLSEVIWYDNSIVVLYGVRVRKDGVSFGRDVPVSGSNQEVRCL